jgi:transcriptional regulator with XRE-family HTH domain
MKYTQLLEAKEKKGVSYNDMEGALGIDRSALSSILNGTRYASLKSLTKIGDYLGINPTTVNMIYTEHKIEAEKQRMEDLKKRLKILETTIQMDSKKNKKK